MNPRNAIRETMQRLPHKNFILFFFIYFLKSCLQSLLSLQVQVRLSLDASLVVGGFTTFTERNLMKVQRLKETII